MRIAAKELVVMANIAPNRRSHLVSDLPCHIPLCSLEGAETAAEIELDVIPFAFHADSQ